MNLNNRITVIFVFLASIFYMSCEKDDVCIQELVTPRMIMVFLSNETNKPQLIDTLIVIRYSEGMFRKINKDTINVDTVYAPLPMTTDFSSFIFYYFDNKRDTINVSYKRNNVYVNKACGFKTIFSNISLNYTTHKISKIIINKKTIESEKGKLGHISIYF